MATKKMSRLNAAILEMVEDLRGGAIKEATAAKITLRILGDDRGSTLPPLRPEEIRALRQSSNMSQAVFARLLNVTTGYVSQLEHGTKRPTNPTLALLDVIKRKGIQAIL